MKLKGTLILFFFSLLSIDAQEYLKHPAMTLADFKNVTNIKKKLVLVNFSASWCVICKKQKPVLDKINAAKKDTISLIEIDMENSPEIAGHYEVDGLPVNLLYYEGTLVWNRMGFQTYEELMEILRLYQRVLVKKN